MKFQIIKLVKLRNICDIFNYVRVPYKFWKIVKKLSTDKIILVFKQDKGSTVRSCSDR